MRASCGRMIHQITKIHHAARSRRRNAMPTAINTAAYTKLGTMGIVNIEMTSLYRMK